MRSKAPLLSFIIFQIFFLGSCGSDRSDDFIVVPTDSVFDYHAIVELDGVMYAVGGEPFGGCDLARSENGDSWQVSYLGNRGLFDLDVIDDHLLAVGNDGYVYVGTGDGLTLLPSKHKNMLRAATQVPGGYLTVGGKDWNKGWIYTIDTEGQILSEYTLGHQLADVVCDGSGYCIAVGYGVILKSVDFGTTWAKDEEIGDFFHSVAFNDAGIAYIIGYRGSLMSADAQNGWVKTQDGHSPLGKNTAFRKIKFFGKKGIIVGDDGVIWHSSDDGETWVDMSIISDKDLFDVHLYGQRLYIASEEGNIVVVDL